MADIIPNANPINDQEVAARAPVTEALNNKIGANINMLLLSALPVGSKIDTFLTEEEFQQEIDSTNWVLCDGRSIIGSRLHAITGWTNLPDMRGLFTRGKNNGRNDGKQDPAGERELGSYQADEFKEHFHQGLFGIAESNVAKGTDRWGVNFNNSTAGGAETRSRNGCMNYMVRIN